jgi:5-formyltetrahydrofolate cyclo-ligase
MGVVAVVRDAELLPAGAVPREAHDQVMSAALTPTRHVPLDR